MGRDVNKGEASHELSRFLCFGKEGVLRGREFGDQVHTFSHSVACRFCTTPFVAWNLVQIEEIVGQLRAGGQKIRRSTMKR